MIPFGGITRITRGVCNRKRNCPSSACRCAAARSFIFPSTKKEGRKKDYAYTKYFSLICALELISKLEIDNSLKPSAFILLTFSGARLAVDCVAQADAPVALLYLS